MRKIHETVHQQFFVASMSALEGKFAVCNVFGRERQQHSTQHRWFSTAILYFLLQNQKNEARSYKSHKQSVSTFSILAYIYYTLQQGG